MASSIIDSNYYCDVFGTAEMRDLFSDEQRVKSWLKTEVALAFAEAKVGFFPEKIAKEIADAAKLENLDLIAMKAEFDRVGFPISPFVHQLNKACSPEAVRWVHYGATTQDITDTGTVLQIKEGLKVVEKETQAIINALIKLAKKYKYTVMPGRTFQQHAAPITFGYKVAVWLDEMRRHRDRLSELKSRILVGECAGAVGTFATLGDKGLEVQKEMMDILGLEVPAISWHVARDNWAEMISCFAMQSATLAKIANEVTILMRSEIRELSEPYEVGRGASSTLPQKRNPISCEPIIAIAHKMREATGLQLSAMIQDHERPVGPTHLEWIIIPESFILFSGSLKHSKFVLENLVVYEHRMRENLKLGGGLLMSESVMMGLAPKIGKKKAHDMVYTIAGKANDLGITLREALLNDENITNFLSESEIDKLIDPINYTGVADKMIDAVLAKYNEKQKT